MPGPKPSKAAKRADPKTTAAGQERPIAPPADSSVLSELIEIRTQQARLDEYRHRADEIRDQVDLGVYERVTEDYTRQRGTLERQAEPLTQTVRAEYQELCRLHDELTSRLSAARLDDQEVEFRHQVGEIDDAERKQRQDETQRMVTRCAAELEALDTKQALYREALADAIDEVAPPVPVEPTVEAPEATPSEASTAPPLPVEATVEAPEATPSEKSPPPPVEPETPPPASPTRAIDDRTFLVPDAILTSDGDGGEAINYRLVALNRIGRADDNHLHLNTAGVSRYHAVISVDDGGCVLRDLESQNGTFVNGNQIREHRLSDGDLISIGENRFVFRYLTSG